MQKAHTVTAEGGVLQLKSLTDVYCKVVCSVLNFGFEWCAEQLYKASHQYTTPGTTWSYLSCHLQFAAAMAVRALLSSHPSIGHLCAAGFRFRLTD